MSNRRFVFFNSLQSSSLISSWRRARVLRMMGLPVIRRPIIRDGTYFGSNRVEISDGCFVNHQCYFDGSEWVRLGERVQVAPRVTFLTSTHEIGGSDCRAGADIAKPITIESGCWIGAGSIIFPGVRVAEGCVIAAGSVVMHDTAPQGLYAGSPAVRKDRLLP
jgi:maltose O-acetyltransferase